jgi:hypothetical protein
MLSYNITFGEHGWMIYANILAKTKEVIFAKMEKAFSLLIFLVAFSF